MWKSLPARFWLLFSLQITSILATTECYYPDGTLQTADTPCTSGGSASVCCGTGWSCLSDGVCSIQEEEQGTNYTFYYRGTCTDQSWEDPACLNICRDGSADVQGTHDNTSLALKKCSRSDNEDFYCCTNDPNCSCPSQEGAVYSLAAHQPFTVTVVSASTWLHEVTRSPPSSTSRITGPNTATNPTQTSTSSNTASTSSSNSATAVAASSTPSPTTTSNSSNSHSLAIGLGLGIGLGLALIIALISGFFFFRRRNRNRHNNDPYNNTNGPAGAPGHNGDETGIYYAQQQQRQHQQGSELPTKGAERYEADGSPVPSQREKVDGYHGQREPVELPGS